MTNNTQGKKSETPTKLKQSAIATYFGVTSRRIRTLETEGHFKRDDGGLYDVKEVAAVFAAMDSDRRLIGRENVGKSPDESGVVGEAPTDDGPVPAIAISKAKKEAYSAELTRIKAQRALGELVEREVVEATLEAIGAETVTSLRNLIPKLRPYMSDEGRKVLDRAIDAALRDIGRKLEKILEDQHPAPDPAT